MLIEQTVYYQLKCMLQLLACVFHLKNILSLHRMSLQICRNLINGMLLFQIFNRYNVDVFSFTANLELCRQMSSC
jgi:hypothetical protein